MAFFAFSLACSGDSEPPHDPTIAAEQTIVAELSRDPTPVPPLGTTCQTDFPPSFSQTAGRPSGKVAFRMADPFCIAWTDKFQNETGFVVRLDCGGTKLEYQVAANVIEVFSPPDDCPERSRRRDISFLVFALTPNGEEVVDGMAVDFN